MHLSRSTMRWFFALAAVFAAVAYACPASAADRVAADPNFQAAERDFDSGDYKRAINHLALVIDSIENGGDRQSDARLLRRLAVARFLLGWSYEHLGNWDRAIDSYRVSLKELPQVDDAIGIRLARCYRENRHYGDAISVLRGIVDDQRESEFGLPALEALGDCYYEARGYDMALQWYRLFLADAEVYDDRARAHYLMGLAHEGKGNIAAAMDSYAAAVEDFPRSREAYRAQGRGRRLSRSFTDRYHQGLVLYNRKRFREASEFFSYYLKHNREKVFAREATYFLGRSHQRKGSLRSAIRKYDDRIKLGAEGDYFGLAWLKKAYCLRAKGDIEGSLSTYEQFVLACPDHELAPQAMWDRARLLEEEKRWEEAGGAFCALRSRYPTSEYADRALLRSGLCLFKRGLYEQAQASFADLFAGGSEASAAKALFWAGKCMERERRTDEALECYREASEMDGDSYYGLRSLDRLAALDSAGPRGSTYRPNRVAPWAGGSVNWGGSEALEFSTWLSGWHGGVYSTEERLALSEKLTKEPALVRAEILLSLHMRGAAERELRSLEESIREDPRLLDILTGIYERMGLHRKAVRAAERILAMSPADGMSKAPIYLRKKICPRHFTDAVLDHGSRRGLDPNLFYSLIRQESVFEPEAVSWAGARGLAQVMPSTGRWIARRLGRRPYRTSHLLAPELSIEFGSYYLSLQVERFDGDILRALAAYNGGPDSAERWWGYSDSRDSDVFVEDIGFSETSDYVKIVYRYYRFYEDIYGVGS